MNSENIYIYTDASYDKSHQIGVIGYVTFNSSEEHENTILSKEKINLIEIIESNNIRAEIRGALTALKSCPKAKKIVTLFTDCQTLCGLSERRINLESTQFISKSKNKPLANKDLYLEFYSLFDIVKPEIKWVKGHVAKNKLDLIQKNFSFLDKMVRHRLREIISLK